jgi:hypothetical protein
MKSSIRVFFAILILGLTFGAGWTLAQQQSPNAGHHFRN